MRSAIVGTVCGTGPFGNINLCASSFATPRAAAAAAIVRQYFTEGFHPSGEKRPQGAFTPSGALIKAVLLNAVQPPEGEHPCPSNDAGWGTLRVANLLPLGPAARSLRVVDVRNRDGLLTGTSREFDFVVGDPGRPLAITLVWTEPPGTSGADDPVVNNLDLIVTSPSNKRFLGNVLLNGISVEGGQPDARNNVERVVIPNPTPGTWHVVVNAAQVIASFGPQGFSLAISGNFAT